MREKRILGRTVQTIGPDRLDRMASPNAVKQRTSVALHYISGHGGSGVGAPQQGTLRCELRDVMAVGEEPDVVDTMELHVWHEYWWRSFGKCSRAGTIIRCGPNDTWSGSVDAI